MKLKYKYLLFDMDGTIANTDELVVQSMFALYDKYKEGKRRPKEECYYFSGPPIRETLRKEFPDLDTEMLAKEFVVISKPMYDTLVTPYPYSHEVFMKLKEAGARLVVVTNKQHDLAEYCLKCIGLDDVFDFVIGSNDVSVGKPNREGIDKALAIMGCKDKKEALYLGDNPIDYQTSVNAEIDCLLVTWGPRKLPENIKPKYLLSDYRDLLEDIL